MQVLQISSSPDENKCNIFAFVKLHKYKAKPHKNTLNSCFTFTEKTDPMTGLVNILALFAGLHGSIWGLEFQPQGPSVLNI